MMRPGGSPRPRNAAGGVLPFIPVTPEMLAALAQSIAGGVTSVQYADRRVDFMSLSDLMRAYEWCAAQLGAVGNVPMRRVASFSKGLPPSSPAPWAAAAGAEHVEVADTLWSREVDAPPGHVDDVDWEQR